LDQLPARKVIFAALPDEKWKAIEEKEKWRKLRREWTALRLEVTKGD
jgi:hypothetical protein